MKDLAEEQILEMRDLMQIESAGVSISKYQNAWLSRLMREGWQTCTFLWQDVPRQSTLLDNQWEDMCLHILVLTPINFPT